MWDGKKVVVTGGASFIGSHLVEALTKEGAEVWVIDDLSSGVLSKLPLAVTDKRTVIRDIHNYGSYLPLLFQGTAVVFHLAADHGGRGYVATQQVATSRNLALDSIVFKACYKASVGKVVYASSGCVYPNYLQGDTLKTVHLSEDMVGPPYNADNLYGWAKLMGELTLKAYYEAFGMKSAICRYFTVYGPRGKEDHAIMAMIARARAGMDPFTIWGDGNQIRNWTYVDDIVSGTLLAAEVIEDASAVNLGVMQAIRVCDAVEQVIFSFPGYRPLRKYMPDMPTGPVNRVADNRLAYNLLGWAPKWTFEDGLARTIEWYKRAKTPDQARRILDAGGLFARKVA